MSRQGIVVSNCQCAPLAHALSINCRDISFSHFGVHIIPPDQKGDHINWLLDKERGFDVVVAIPLSDDWGDISAAKIRSSFSGRPVVMVSNIYFSGLHPDLTYIGGLANRVAGPLGDYHSKLALFAFLSGKTVKEALELFSDGTYARFGFYDEYQKSLTELHQRDAGVDVPVSTMMEALLKKDLCLFSVNHPSSALFGPYAQIIAKHMDAQGLCKSASMSPSPFLYENPLASSGIFPVYPEIAAKHGLSYAGSMDFKPEGIHANPLDLQAFVTAEFAAFDVAGRENLLQTPAGQGVMSRFSA